MKKRWWRYLLAELVAIILVVGFFWISHTIDAGKVYQMPVATLLSSYKEDQQAFIKKYNKHIVYVTGRVYYVFEKGDDDYVYKQGTLYKGSFVQLMDPTTLPESDTKVFYDHSIQCRFYNKNLKMFQNIDFLDPMKTIMLTIKGTLYVNNDEVFLVDCTKVENDEKK
jgi:hypothetical protein